jgi:hypothetical protein
MPVHPAPKINRQSASAPDPRQVSDTGHRGPASAGAITARQIDLSSVPVQMSAKLLTDMQRAARTAGLSGFSALAFSWSSGGSCILGSQGC